VPGRKAVTDYLQALGAFVNDQVKNDLATVDHMAITADKWTSIANKSYLGITGHFISQDWKMKSVGLAVQKMAEDKTAANIRKRIEQMIAKMNLTFKIRSITTDNEASMRAAGMAMESDSMLTTQYLPCVAHTLQLVVNDGLKVR
jgi:uncharacterized protein YacL (UPF0231 family)